MDNDTNLEITTDDNNLGVEIAKTLAVSAAAAAGTLIGFIVVGYAYGKVTDLIKARRAKKTPTTTEK